MLVDVNAAFAPDKEGDLAAALLMDARLRAGERIGITTHIVTSAIEPFSPANGLLVRRAVLLHPGFLPPSEISDVDTDALRRGIGRVADRGAVAIAFGFSASALWQFASEVLAGECERFALPICLAERSVIVAAARAHPQLDFVCAALGDDPYWESTIASVAPLTNVAVDISGARTERGMLDRALAVLGPDRLLWGTGSQMETGLAQLRALDVIAPGADVIEAIRWKNAFRIFPKLAEGA